MPEVLVATPLKHFAVTKPYNFSDGISIRELAPILWDISIVKGYVSEHEREYLAEAKYWLCAGKEVEHVFGDVGDDLYSKATYAAWALQIICPSGAKHAFLKFQKSDKGYDNVGSKHPKELCSTLLGRVTHLEDQGLERYFDAVYTGTQRAFLEKIVRLQNPISLIEHGMQVGNVPISVLLFVMGLDILFMAGEIRTFVERLGGFLGLDSYVFPPDSIMNLQPNTTVRDVLNDLYEFRNIIAHGQEIPETPYRQKCCLVSTTGSPINRVDYTHAELMLESALFMLTTSLRKIFVEGLFDKVKEPGRWREKLKQYEHRYKDTGGLSVIKTRGR